MENFLQQLLNGLSLGGIYALIALGYTMVYGVLKLINFAHGDLFTIGAYVGFTLLVSVGITDSVDPMAALIIMGATVMLFVATLGVGLERAAYRPLRHSPRLSAVVSALGASIFFQNAVMLIYGARFHVYPQGLFTKSTLSLFGLYLPLVKVFVLMVSLVVMTLLYFFIQKTLTGAAIRAVAIDHNAARLVGINVDKVVTIVFVVGPALGGLAGLMVGLLYGQITFTMGWLYGLKAFTAAILGGIGNIPGAMLGGIILGIIESMASAYLSIAWKDAVTFVVLILILTIRPTGILGERIAEKV
ncbi:MAG: branched-chain amino acid ABC transporter permease [Syntrophobacterales bacterium]|nr:branched-chain amino acid ABC transporter permease [Syntrophobacterales bacterium]